MDYGSSENFDQIARLRRIRTRAVGVSSNSNQPRQIVQVNTAAAVNGYLVAQQYMLWSCRLFPGQGQAVIPTLLRQHDRLQVSVPDSAGGRQNDHIAVDGGCHFSPFPRPQIGRKQRRLVSLRE